MRNFFKAVVLVAALVPAVGLAAIAGSKHDMASGSVTTGPKAVVGATGTDQTCIFCHTPHRAIVQSLIWNHTSSASTPGWTVGQSTTAGTPLPTSLQSASAGCLSCHDGSIGLGNLHTGAVAMAAHADINAAGQITAAQFQVPANLGTANQANHPVSVPYAASTYFTVVSNATVGAGAYVAPAAAGCTSPSGICTANSTSIQLFGTVAGTYGIECGSCHDVHNSIAGTTKLLRVPSANSAICLACHSK